MFNEMGNYFMAEGDQKQLVRKSTKKGLVGGSARYFDGGKRSIAVLKANNFDPITELVNTYKHLLSELQFWEDVRSGRKIPLDGNGKPLRYNADAHVALLNLKATIGDKLLRYGYGRVPEHVEPPKVTQPLIINLGGTDGTFSINEPLEGEIEDEEE